MGKIHIGGNEREFLAIEVRGWQYPHARDPDDGNWLNAEVELQAGGFRGRVTGYLRARDFPAFRDQVASLYQTLAGEARF